MNKFRFTIKLLVIAIFTFAFASMAQAQAPRTWVSGVGDDVNPCSRTAPCKTFAGAISKTAKDGEIDALDPAGFGAVTVTKSITIDGSMTGVGGILNSVTNGILINITDAADVRKAVTIRGLSIQGGGTGLRGIEILAGLAVFVENTFISGQNGSPGHGIDDVRTAGGQLEINNVTIQNCAGNGINVNPSSGSTQINVHINNSRVQRNATGFFAGSNVRATIYDSVFTQNTTAGISAQQTAGGTTDVNCDHCMVSNNVTGFAGNTASSIIRVSNTTALNNSGANNAGLASIAGGGIVTSYGNNQTGGVAFPSTGTAPTE
jgi:Right handed beta helix region